MAQQRDKKDDFAHMEQRVKKTLLGAGVYKAFGADNQQGDDLKQKKVNTAKPKRNALGRGLSALMASSAVEVQVERPAPESVPPANIKAEVTPIQELRERRSEPEVRVVSEPEVLRDGNGGLTYIALDRIVRNESQPRQDFAEHELEALAQSIRQSGLLQPILLRKLEDGRLEIVAGERRWRAARRAGLNEVPAIIKQLDDRSAFGLAIVENLQREDLNPVEEALAYQRLIEEFGQSQGEVAETVGKDRASIANALRLLKLPNPIREMLRNKKISAGHGRALLMLDDEAKQIALAEKIIREGLSVRAVEREVSKPKGELKPLGAAVGSSSERNLAVVALEERLRRGLGTKVSLVADAQGKGELKISFFSQGELESLLERLGV